MLLFSPWNPWFLHCSLKAVTVTYLALDIMGNKYTEVITLIFLGGYFLNVFEYRVKVFDSSVWLGMGGWFWRSRAGGQYILSVGFPFSHNVITKL